MLTLTTLNGGTTMPPRLSNILRALWRTDAPLTAAGLLMLGALAVFGTALWLDPRTITGAPAWLKPAKFAASTAIFSLTLAWIFRYLPDWPRTRRVVSLATASIFVLEVAIIAAQAARGTTSHFNVGTPLDATLFSIMGGAIVLQTLASVAVAVALWRQRFANEVLGWALRLGMTLTIVGAASGGLMTRPTDTQLADARAGLGMAIAGAHTVGAADGGPGLPGTGWSVEHGDLRVPHFLGLHAVQVLPLLTLLFARRTEMARVRFVIVAGMSYGLLFGILVWQALRGQSMLAPDVATLTALATWAFATAAAMAVAARSRAVSSAVLVS
jgi:hypothetical protein